MSTPQHENARGHFEELSSGECMELLAAKHVGRVGLCSPKGPAIFPVNYKLHNNSVLFRTSAYSVMAGELNDATAAFEVDEIDEYLECGWSVLILGHAAHVTDPDGLPHRNDHPEPWARGIKSLFIQIDPIEITGRRVHPT